MTTLNAGGNHAMQWVEHWLNLEVVPQVCMHRNHPECHIYQTT